MSHKTHYKTQVEVVYSDNKGKLCWNSNFYSIK